MEVSKASNGKYLRGYAKKIPKKYSKAFFLKYKLSKEI